MIKRLAVIGVGLIGGSLALALKKKGAVSEVVGYDCAKHASQEALQCAIIDRIATSITDAVQGADWVFLAVPVAAMTDVFAELKDAVGNDAVITDGSSVKGQVVTSADHVLGEKFSQFVPGHPITGTEKSGPTAAVASLYQYQRVILTPLAQTSQSALMAVRSMWQKVGAEVFEMDADHHDMVLAATSHLPHVLAFSLINMLAQRDDCAELLRYAAGGFEDFSRIASSDAVMWRDICLANSKAVLALLTQYQQGLTELQTAIKASDGDALLSSFIDAKRTRDKRFAQN